MVFLVNISMAENTPLTLEVIRKSEKSKLTLYCMNVLCKNQVHCIMLSLNYFIYSSQHYTSTKRLA